MTARTVDKIISTDGSVTVTPLSGVGEVDLTVVPSGAGKPNFTDGTTTIDTPALIEIAGATLTGDETEAVFTLPGASGGPSLTENSGPVVSSGLLPLQLTKQPVVPQSGILQPLPPLFGFEFSGIFNTFVLAGSEPIGICTGPDGSLWVAEIHSNVWRVTTDGTATPFALAGSSNQGICAGPDGNLWVADNTGAVWKVTTAGAPTKFTVGIAGSNPIGICAGPDGNLYMVTGAPGVGQLLQIDTAGAVLHTFAIGGNPQNVCAGPDGNLWVADIASRVVRVTTGGVATDFPMGTAPYFPCTGPDGNLWIADSAGDQVLKVATDGTLLAAIPLAGSNPQWICVGAGGDLWVADDGGALWKVTTSGIVTKFVIAGKGLTGICSGPDGGLWLTDLYGNVLVFPFTVIMSSLRVTQGPLVLINQTTDGLIISNENTASAGTTITDTSIDGITIDASAGQAIVDGANNVVIQTLANILTDPLPTMDPHIVNALYNLAGVVHVSAG